MTGPGHYRAAERLAAEAARGEESAAKVQSMIALAQAHATLALAAATVDAVCIADDRRNYNPTTDTEKAWVTATS